jgi:hypothetical protein
MAESSSYRCGLDKRKACVFLILVAVGILCLVALTYMLFYAPPRSSSTIKNGGHTMLRPIQPDLTVHSRTA